MGCRKSILCRGLNKDYIKYIIRNKSALYNILLHVSVYFLTQHHKNIVMTDNALLQ